MVLLLLTVLSVIVLRPAAALDGTALEPATAGSNYTNTSLDFDMLSSQYDSDSDLVDISTDFTTMSPEDAASTNLLNTTIADADGKASFSTTSRADAADRSALSAAATPGPSLQSSSTDPAEQSTESAAAIPGPSLASSSTGPAEQSAESAAAIPRLAISTSQVSVMLFHVLRGVCSEGAANGVAEELGNEQNRYMKILQDQMHGIESNFTSLQLQLQDQLAELQDQNQRQMEHLQDLLASGQSRQMETLRDQERNLQAALQGLLSSDQIQPVAPLLDRLATEHEQQMTQLQEQLTSSQQRLQQQLAALEEQQEEQASFLRDYLASGQRLYEQVEVLQEQQRQMTAVQKQQGREMLSLKDLLTSMAAKSEQQLADLQSSLSAVQGRLLSPAAQHCPDGWSRHSHSCYLIPTTEATWLGAVRICQSLDRRAQLVSIHRANADHVAALKALVGGSVWIGLSRKSLSRSSYRWTWSDGSRLDFTNWAPGEPNDGNVWFSSDAGQEDCVLMRTSATWNDEGCSKSKRFMCQINLN